MGAGCLDDGKAASPTLSPRGSRGVTAYASTTV